MLKPEVIPFSYAGMSVADMHHLALVQAYEQCLTQEKRREEASKHPKFQKMKFPPPNPLFLQVKQALLNELNSRNIKSGNGQ